MLDGDSLAAELAKEAGFTYGGEPLSIVYAAAREQLGDKIWPIFEDRFHFCQPSAAIRTIAEFPWPRIYTLNIDDSLERAAQQTRVQNLAIRHRKDKIAQINPFFERLDLIKLNGSVDRLDAGLIFSPQEYGEGSANTPPWYEEVAEDYFRYLFLFIGTRLNEPLFHHQVERYRRVANATSGKSYVLTRTATDIERTSLASLHLIHLPGTIDDFAVWLKREFPKKPTPWELAVATYPQLGKLSERIDAQKYAALFDKVVKVSRADLAVRADARIPRGQIRNFYRGFKPTWQDILDGVPAQLKALASVQKRILATKQSEKIFVIHGPAGSGKTTTLMQLALGLADSSALPVYYLVEPIGNIAELISALENSETGRYYLLVDRISLVIDGVRKSIANGALSRGIVVATERQNVWNHRVKAELAEDVADAFPLSVIDETEAVRILGQLEEFGPWTRLGKMTRKARVDELVKKARRQLLIGLLEATSGSGFEEIIQNDFASLTSEAQRKFVVLVGLATIHRMSMPEDIAARALTNMGIMQGVERLFSETSGIVYKEGRGLNARHPVYIEHLFESSVGKERKFEAIEALLKALSVYETPSPVATSNSPTCGRVKLLHPGWRDEGTLVGYEALGKHG